MNDDEKRRQYEELLGKLNGPQEDPMMSNEIVQGANTSVQEPSIPMPPIPMSPSPMMSQEPEPPVVMPKGLDVFSRPDTDLAQTLADDGMTPMQLLGREQEGVEDKAAAEKREKAAKIEAEKAAKAEEDVKKAQAKVREKAEAAKAEIARLEKIKKDYAEGAMDRAKEQDANTNFMNRMLEAGAMANRGIAGRAGHKITGKDPSKLKANAESGLRADEDAKLKKMLAAYKMSGGGKEGMTEFQKKKLKNSEKREARLTDKQKEDESRKKKSMFVPGVGYALSPTSAKDMREAKSGTDDAISMLEKVKELGKDVSVLDPRDFGRVKKIDSLLNQAVGKMRVSLTGGGPLTDPERVMIRESIGDPTSLRSTEKAETGKLDQLIGQMKENLENRYKNEGVVKAPKEANSPKKAETVGRYGKEVEKNGKVYKWNPIAEKYQLK